MVGMSIARSTRSGTLVGPGICRKCLPACTVIGVLPGLALAFRAARIPLFGGLVPLRAAAVNALEAGLHREAPPPRSGRAKFIPPLASIAHHLERRGIVAFRSAFDVAHRHRHAAR